MASAATNTPDAKAASAAPAATPAPAVAAPAANAGAISWRQVWQVPALAAAVVLLGGGVIVAFLRAPKPNHDDAFRVPETLFHEEKFGETIAALNQSVLPHYTAGALTNDQRRRYHLLVARSLFLGQRALGLDREENHKAIVEQFEHAEKLGATLEARDTGFLADSFLALGRWHDARERAESLPESARDLKVSLLQRMVTKAMSGPVPNDGLALELLSLIASEPEAPRDVRAWITARQAEILLAQGYTQEAITRLLRSMQRTGVGESGSAPRPQAELFVLLARAYMQTESPAEAGRQLAQAEALLTPEDPLMAEVLVQQARVEFNTDRAKALDRYSQVVSRFASSEQALSALLGLAEVHALQQNHEEALERYASLVERLRGGQSDREVTVGKVSSSLLSNFRERYDAEDYALAARYAVLAETLAGSEPKPPEVLKALAEVHRRLGEEVLHSAGLTPEGLAKADPATQTQARRYFVEAGGYYKAHSDQVVLTDTTAYGESLWAAAQMFDRAGDTSEAIDEYQLFATGFPGDARQPEAKFHLAQAYQAHGDLATAERLYRDLMESRGTPEGAGPFADASFVPLARVWLADGRPENDADAERLLLVGVSGELGGPETETYRAAIEELSLFYYRVGRTTEAIERLDEVVRRYGGAPQPDARVDVARFRLGDAHRQAAAELRRKLESGGVPDSAKRPLEKERGDHLRQALGILEQARRSLEALPRRAELEDRCLRNAYFYLGESAFELGEYELAIRHYDAAKERYPREPSSLVAMVQIVSAHKELGDLEKARTANSRARRFFESLPDSVWDDPTLPMDRRAWERWLESASDLGRAEAGAADASPQGGG